MSDDLTQAIQEATELVKASKKTDKKQKSSENMNRYRIFRVEVDEKTGEEKQITMRKFSAKSNEDAYKELQKYVKVANREYTYYWGHAEGHCGLGKDKKLHTFDTIEELHEFYKSEYKDTFLEKLSTPFVRLGSKLSDFKYWLKDIFYLFKHKHNRNESWSLDYHLIEDLKFNLPLIIKTISENNGGVPHDMCIKALAEKHANDANYDPIAAFNANPNVIWTEKGVMDLAHKKWLDELKAGLLNIRLYYYYSNFGIIDEKKELDMLEVHKEYAKTIPYVKGTYKEIDYLKLNEMTKKCWNRIWTWLREYGQDLWLT